MLRVVPDNRSGLLTLPASQTRGKAVTMAAMAAVNTIARTLETPDAEDGFSSTGSVTAVAAERVWFASAALILVWVARAFGIRDPY
jgi:hypothetical protein